MRVGGVVRNNDLYHGCDRRFHEYAIGNARTIRLHNVRVSYITNVRDSNIAISGRFRTPLSCSIRFLTKIKIRICVIVVNTFTKLRHSSVKRSLDANRYNIGALMIVIAITLCSQALTLTNNKMGAYITIGTNRSYGKVNVGSYNWLKSISRKSINYTNFMYLVYFSTSTRLLYSFFFYRTYYISYTYGTLYSVFSTSRFFSPYGVGYSLACYLGNEPRVKNLRRMTSYSGLYHTHDLSRQDNLDISTTIGRCQRKSKYFT